MSPSPQVYVLSPLENLRGYVTTRPPLVLFMVSVSAVAIAFLTIGYFFKIKEIKSPELTEVRGGASWRLALMLTPYVNFLCGRPALMLTCVTSCGGALL